jgi:hypothetical protein
MTRPIVALNDLELIFAPAFCEDSFHHVVMECFTGALETEYFVTRAMKQYVGEENARRGLAFNKSIAELFEAAGWSVRLELAMTELKAPPKEATGDIDVLAWRGDSAVFVNATSSRSLEQSPMFQNSLRAFVAGKGTICQSTCAARNGSLPIPNA